MIIYYVKLCRSCRFSVLIGHPVSIEYKTCPIICLFYIGQQGDKQNFYINPYEIKTRYNIDNTII